ncbi:YeeE/YedE family protein [Dinoroseobacter sp. S76]|uniref:YeeE/YedE family protein n=1 Tax=Dinoroseobacter sp. S76 TaxID=3415124 RepID=UPI003C7A7673
METAFTPGMSLLGGSLIGLAAVALMALHGRIFGATGILAGALLPASPGDRTWRLALLAGMVSGPILVWLISGALPEVQVPVSLPALLVGGVLVGIGVTLGSGCTSGHGVCGMARLSRRSIVATLVFMATCGATVFVIRHGIGG